MSIHAVGNSWSGARIHEIADFISFKKQTLFGLLFYAPGINPYINRPKTPDKTTIMIGWSDFPFTFTKETAIRIAKMTNPIRSKLAPLSQTDSMPKITVKKSPRNTLRRSPATDDLTPVNTSFTAGHA